MNTSFNTPYSYSWDEEDFEHKRLPLDHPLVRGQPINIPIYEQDYQWRLKIQSFSKGGFEAKAVLVNRNRLNAMILMNRERGLRSSPKEREPFKIQLDREKAAFRAARKVRHLCIEMGVDRLLTLTSRHLLIDYDHVVATWKRFMRLLEQAGAKTDYVAVPELHASGEHYHIHAGLSGFVQAELLRRCWQIALGGMGNERGSEALGNVDIKHRRDRTDEPMRRAVSIAKYLSKYITKSYLAHYEFNRRRYWSPRTIKLPESQAEWMRADAMVDAIAELHLRVGSSLTVEAFNESIFISEANVPLIFFRHIPCAPMEGDTPF
jgi:hypothetical protein